MGESFHMPRSQKRIRVDLTVTLTTVLDSIEAQIVDLTEGGAQIVGAGLKQGDLIQIEYGEKTVYARVMWSEIDRMGVRFPFELREGPLFDVLEAARGANRGHGYMPGENSPTTGSAGFARTVTGRFGRRV